MHAGPPNSSFLCDLTSSSLHLLLLLQAALLGSFPAVFDELLQMFTVQEVAELVRGSLGSLPSAVGPSMELLKLQAIARTVDCRLFSFPGQWLLLLSTFFTDLLRQSFFFYFILLLLSL